MAVQDVVKQAKSRGNPFYAGIELHLDYTVGISRGERIVRKAKT
jgi:hypothetical protein